MHFASEMSKHAKLVYFEPHSFFACRSMRTMHAGFRIRSPKQCSLLPSAITMHFAKLM